MSDLRELNGHPLRVLRAQHNLTLEELSQETGVAPATISRAENSYLVSPAVRKILCKYFNKTSRELGLLGKSKDLPPDPVPPQSTTTVPEQLLTIVPPPLVEKKEAPVIIVAHNQALDLLNEHSEHTSEQQLGAWLALEAGEIGQLFDAGWTVEAILNSLRIMLEAVQGMPTVTRRKLLQLSSAAIVSGVSLPTEKHISEEARINLCASFGKSIGNGWNSLQTASPEQLLTIGQAQMYLLQQNHTMLYSQVKSIFYSAVYNLIGISLHFQEQQEAALEAHESAYLAALAAGDAFNMAQSLICQANAYKASGQYAKSIQTIEEALRISTTQSSEAYLRLHAHLLTCWVDNALGMRDYVAAQRKLEASEVYLDKISPNEEFDRATWLLLAGKYGLATGDHTKAVQCFEEALASLLPSWVLRRTITSIALAIALARKRELTASLAIAEKTLPMLHSMNAKLTGRWFGEYLKYDLLGLFPNDSRVLKFVTDTQQQIPSVVIH